MQAFSAGCHKHATTAGPLMGAGPDRRPQPCSAVACRIVGHGVGAARSCQRRPFMTIKAGCAWRPTRPRQRLRLWLALSPGLRGAGDAGVCIRIAVASHSSTLSRRWRRLVGGPDNVSRLAGSLVLHLAGGGGSGEHRFEHVGDGDADRGVRLDGEGPRDYPFCAWRRGAGGKSRPSAPSPAGQCPAGFPGRSRCAGSKAG